jgi:hypothetical protein
MDLGQIDLGDLTKHLVGPTWTKVCLIMRDRDWRSST